MAWLMLAQAIVAASGEVKIESVAQAKAMTPAALGDALLAPGHPPIDDVEVAPSTMDPPPPPGQFRIILNTRPVSATPGFCQRARIDAMVLKHGGGASVTLTSVETLYRLAATCAGATQSISTYKQAYGRYENAQAMAVIQQLHKLRRIDRGAVRIDYQDDMPRRLTLPRYAGGAEALRAVDLDYISWAGDARRGGSLPREKVWQERRPGADQTGFYAGGMWSGIVTRKDGKITHVWLRRRIPAPF